MLLKYLYKKFELDKKDIGDMVDFWGGISLFSFFSAMFLICCYPKSIPIWMTILAGFILMEILFWISPTEKLNKKQQKKTFGKTILLKLDCLYTVFILFTLVSVMVAIIPKLTIEVLLMVLKIAGYIVGGVLALGIVVGILYLWIKLNERKFKK